MCPYRLQYIPVHPHLPNYPQLIKTNVDIGPLELCCSTVFYCNLNGAEYGCWKDFVWGSESYLWGGIMMRFIFLASRLAFVRPIAEVFYFVTCTSVLNLKTLTLPDGLNQNTLECRAPNDAKKKRPRRWADAENPTKLDRREVTPKHFFLINCLQFFLIFLMDFNMNYERAQK